MVDDEDEDENEEGTTFSLEDLLNDNDEEKAGEDDRDELGEEVSVKVMPKSSPKKSDSFLSETRYKSCIT